VKQLVRRGDELVADDALGIDHIGDRNTFRTSEAILDDARHYSDRIAECIGRLVNLFMSRSKSILMPTISRP
jgi:hypothetical protein